MKHFMLPRNPILRENEQQWSTNPSFSKSKPPRKPKAAKENAPPPDLNSLPLDHRTSPAAKMKSPLPPRPPSSNPLKRKLSTESALENGLAGGTDSGVKVIVRMRPPNKGEEEDMIVQKISSDSLTINGHTFTFDLVADTEATQQDIFQFVGAPLVENCLAGFNSSVFAYGQTGSGKTYTIWGPANALLEENLAGEKKGLTPRVFERLFARIDEEQTKHAEKQLNYQCRCSFLEIYNEQITDLLDPNQKNLLIREDVSSGVYVENLTDEYVCNLKDVTQLLIKGLSNRRTGATSINAESSRSHCVFTCVVESRCKSGADGVSNVKTSRINLVDLAGSERQKLTGAAGDRLKEAGNINRSLSQLGNLINILAEISQTGKQRHIPYRDSKLTFLLQESLGGNAKLAMVCAVSPSPSCRSETFSTLRFAQRAKAIQNKAVVNEVVQDDVNFLREVIRQLRDELQRMKANGNNPADPNTAYSTAWNARRSLNLLRSFGLNHPRSLPHGDDDGDTEMEIDEEAVERLCLQVGLQSTTLAEQNHGLSREERKSTVKDIALEDEHSRNSHPKSSQNQCIIEEVSEDADISMEEDASEIQNHDVMLTGYSKPATNNIDCTACPVSLAVQTIDGDSIVHAHSLDSSASELKNTSSPSKVENLSSIPVSNLNGDISVSPLICDSSKDSEHALADSTSPPSLSMIPHDGSNPKSPVLSVSPRIRNSRKSLRTSSMLTASQKDGEEKGNEAVHSSFVKPKSSLQNTLCHQKNRSVHVPTEHLAASLHRGMEIIEAYRQSSAQRRSTFMFSYKSPDSKPSFPVSKADAGVQTFPEADEDHEGDQHEFLCIKCKSKADPDEKEINETLDQQLVTVDGSESAEKSKNQVPKAVEKVLAGSIRREMALEEHCAKQASEIMQLNRLVQQYKHERECNAIIGQTKEDKIIRLESLMDGVLPKEEFLEGEFGSLMHEHKILKEKYENHPEILRTKIELNRVQDELERYQNFYDMGEREVLLEEIQDLRIQLQSYIDSSSTSGRRRNSLLKLTYSCDPGSAPSLSAIPESTECHQKKIEEERARWTEVESKWINLTEELRMDLEASRAIIEKQKHEIDTEKKCADELKEAMQMAMEGHARMLEQYADLEERHIQLLARHRRIQEGIDDVKKAAARAGVRGAESRFINALAAEISALKVEREKERQYLRDENKVLKSQLKDTAEAVQAAGELLVRLKEAEESLIAAQKKAMDAEHEAAEAYKEIEKLKRKHEDEVNALNKLITGSPLPKESSPHSYNGHDIAKYDAEDPSSGADQRWREEFEQFYNEDREFSKLAEPSAWFSGYDRCNI